MTEEKKSYIVWAHESSVLAGETPARVRAIGPHVAARVFVAGLGTLRDFAESPDHRCSVVVCVADDGRGEVHVLKVSLGLTTDIVSV